MNRFLASLQITFRRDPTNFRPRVNKLNSIKDREQKGKKHGYLDNDMTLTETLSHGQLLLPGRVMARLLLPIHADEQVPVPVF